MLALNASKRMSFGWSVARARRGLAPTRIPSLVGWTFFSKVAVCGYYFISIILEKSNRKKPTGTPKAVRVT